MSSLRTISKQVFEEAKDGIAWIALYKEYDDWNVACFQPKIADPCHFVFAHDDLKELIKILAIDQNAILVNGKRFNFCLLDYMTVSDLENEFSLNYENRYHLLSDIISATYLDPEAIKQCLTDDDDEIRIMAMHVCQMRDVPIEIIRQGLEDKNFGVRVEAVKACYGYEFPIPMDIIQKCVNDEEWLVRVTAMEAGEFSVWGNVPMDIIREWMTDDECTVRATAMYCCVDREDIPFDIVQAGLSDEDIEVREAAQYLCEKNGYTNLL